MVDTKEFPDILCCVCSAAIQPNASNMCIDCLKNEVNVTEGVSKEVFMHQCRGCMKWQRPPWVGAELESRELLAICLKKISGMNTLKLVDAGWIWTEPHSKRLKVKLTVQKEVTHGAILQQSFVVTFIVRNRQCDDCQAAFSNQSWRAVVQVRQKVSHKRTFYFLEQLILKYGAHQKTHSIKSFPDGIDFYFAERSHALRFVDFLEEHVPIALKKSKKLISADNHSNTHNYKFTYYAEIAPLCKDDLVVLPKKLAHNLGNIAQLALVSQVSSSIHVINPLNLQRAEIDGDKYWRKAFRSICSSKSLVEFTVLDTNFCEQSLSGDRRGGRKLKDRLAEVEVAKNTDFGVNDKTHVVFTHLGNLLNVGDTVMGYDLSTSVFSDLDITDEQLKEFPDVILVRKQFSKSGKKMKNMESLEMDTDEGDAALRNESDYHEFLNELEIDDTMKQQLNVSTSHQPNDLSLEDL